MRIIDYLYFKFVAMRKLRKAFYESDIYIKIAPTIQIARAVEDDKWIIEDDYKLIARIGLKEFKIKGDSVRELLRGLVAIAEER